MATAATILRPKNDLHSPKSQGIRFPARSLDSADAGGDGAARHDRGNLAMTAPGNTDGHAAQRLTFAYFLRELQHYLHLDKGLPRTVVDLVRRPGTMLRGYFDGTGRAGYTNPITYSLMAAAASLLAYGLYREPFVAWVRARMVEPVTAGQASGVPGMGDFMRAYSDNLFQVTQHPAVTSITLAVPQALLLWLLFRSPRFNVAEAFAFALYAIGTFLFVHALVVSPIVYFSHAWGFAQVAGFGLQVAIALWLGLGLFGARLANAAKLVVAFGVSLAVWMVLLTIVVGVYTFASA